MQVAAIFFQIIGEQVKENELKFEKWYEQNQDNLQNINKEVVKKIWMSGKHYDGIG